MSRKMGTEAGMTRRQALGRSMALLGGLAAGGGLVSVPRVARGATTEVTFQLGWIVGNGQIGEIVGRSLGYFEAEPTGRGGDERSGAGAPPRRCACRGTPRDAARRRRHRDQRPPAR
jgi:hypothetical protein